MAAALRLLLNKSFPSENSLLPALAHLRRLALQQNHFKFVKFGALTRFVTILEELQPPSDSSLSYFYF